MREIMRNNIEENVKKMKRIMNPLTAEDYGLHVTISFREMESSDEGREMLSELCGIADLPEPKQRDHDKTE